MDRSGSHSETGAEMRPFYALRVFAVAVNGELSTGPAEYIEAPNLVESSEELKSVLDELTRVIKEVNADKVLLLKPEGGRTPKKTHAAFVPRIARRWRPCHATLTRADDTSENRG